ncbi:hypothetical protein FQN50_002370 [Emmonsiellopsis sp. PD_5]|nr:hypothetical protein FQN50_002370 [Emmonsiellopsis sp. PD_5]
MESAVRLLTGLEFDFRSLGDGRSASARYANNSNYRNDSLIRKEMCVSSLMIAEIKRIIKESEIMKEDDSKWPQKNKDGRQELEIRLGNDHISFETAKIGSLVDVTESADPEGLRVFYYLVQDLKALVFSLISLHFKACSPYFPSPGQPVTNAAPSRSNRFKRISLAKKSNAKWHVFLDTDCWQGPELGGRDWFYGGFVNYEHTQTKQNEYYSRAGQSHVEIDYYI